jgi:hypothetical protein
MTIKSIFVFLCVLAGEISAVRDLGGDGRSVYHADSILILTEA